MKRSLMKSILMKRALLTVISLFSLSAFTVTAATDEDKYYFADLEEVDSFLYRQVRGWQAIDSRSLIVNISAGRSYLVILDRNLTALNFTEQVQFSSRNSRVRANIDQVHVLNQYARPTRIETIYLLPGKAARLSARAKILSEELEVNGINGMNGEVILGRINSL